MSPRPSVPSSRSSDRPIRNTGLDKVPQWGVQDKLLIHGADTRITLHKTGVLCVRLKELVSEQGRIQLEVLCDANIAMSKTIKKNRYKEGE